MKRSLGTAAVFAICTGAMFSSGFFLLPGFASDISGPSLPLVYLVSSVLILPAIFSLSELSAAIPRAGGPYLFLHRSMGPLVGLIGAFASYLQLLLKGAFAFVGVGAYSMLVMDVSIAPVAIGLIVLFTVVNLIGVKQTARAEIVMVVVLLLLLTYFTISGLVQLNLEREGLRERFQPLFPNGVGGFITAIALVFVSYAGIGQITSLAEEVKRPSRSIPVGMLIALAVSAVIYFLGTAAMVGLLAPDELHNDTAPVATTALQFQQLPLPVIVVVIAALAAFASTGNAAIMSAARFPLALARNDLIWKKFGSLDKKGVPRVSVITTGAILILMVLAFEVESIAKMASVFLLFMFVGICIAVIIFRESRIEEYDPKYRSPLYPWVQIAGVIIYAALIVESGAIALLFLAGLCIASILWYRFGVPEQKQHSAAIHHLFGRLAGRSRQRQPIGETGIPVLGGLNMAELVERSMIIDLDEDMPLKEVIQKAADALAGHIGGEREELADHLMDQVGQWRRPLRANIAISPALLEGIEQPEMVVLRGPVRVDDRTYDGLIVLVDDEDSSERLSKLLSQLEGTIQHSAFPTIWKQAEDGRDLKDALIHDIKNVRAIAIEVNAKGPTSELQDKKLEDLGLPAGSRVALVQRQTETIVPHQGTELKEGDRLTVLANEEAMEELVERFDPQRKDRRSANGMTDKPSKDPSEP